jgi:hypothetical protein
VSVSLCGTASGVCARYLGAKSVFLGPASGAAVPSEYSVVDTPCKVRLLLGPGGGERCASGVASGVYGGSERCASGVASGVYGGGERCASGVASGVYG